MQENSGASGLLLQLEEVCFYLIYILVVWLKSSLKIFLQKKKNWNQAGDEAQLYVQGPGLDHQHLQNFHILYENQFKGIAVRAGYTIGTVIQNTMFDPGIIAHSCNPIITWEAKAGNFEFEISLGYIVRFCLNEEKQR
jgi:hypothetical protein